MDGTTVNCTFTEEHIPANLLKKSGLEHTFFAVLGRNGKPLTMKAVFFEPKASTEAAT